MIFIDSSAFFALFYKKDKFHNVAKNLWKKIIKKRVQIFTSRDVFNETVTLIRFKGGYDYSVKFGEMFFQSKIINKIDIDDNLRIDAWEIYLKYSDKDLSFTDCTTISCMRKLGIKNIFTFDEHFKQIGFVVNKV